jgi:hypothetical protein
VAPQRDLQPHDSITVEHASPGTRAAADITEKLYESYEPKRVRVKRAAKHPGPRGRLSTQSTTPISANNAAPAKSETALRISLSHSANRTMQIPRLHLTPPFVVPSESMIFHATVRFCDRKCERANTTTIQQVPSLNRYREFALPRANSCAYVWRS